MVPSESNDASAEGSSWKLAPQERKRILSPPIVTGDLPGIGGRIRSRPEDFVVDEIAANAPDGRDDAHLLLRIEKRGMDTEEALREIARRLGVRRSEIGVAGRKDRLALTRQWISVPATAASSLDRFQHCSMRILEAHPHGQKLRRGHLRGNRFEIVVRDLGCAAAIARQRVEAKLARLRELGGLENLFGPQRFGDRGRNLQRGLDLMAKGHFRPREQFLLSAAQSGLFNDYLVRRREEGTLLRPLRGDLLQRTDSGGMFWCDEPEADAPRMKSGEVVLSGPIYGARMRWPADASPALSFEESILDRFGLSVAQLMRFGKRLPGSRRRCLIRVDGVEIELADAVEGRRRGSESLLGPGSRPGSKSGLGSGLEPGLLLRFTLPPGSYATQLLRELGV